MHLLKIYYTEKSAMTWANILIPEQLSSLRIASLFVCCSISLWNYFYVLFFQVLPWNVTNAPSVWGTYFIAAIRSKTGTSKHLVPKTRMCVSRCQSEVRNSNLKLNYMNRRKLTVRKELQGSHQTSVQKLREVWVNIAVRFDFQKSQNRVQEP